MNRRTLLGSIGAALTPRIAAAEQQAAQATRGLPSPKIRDLKVINTSPGEVRLSVIKVITDQDGLYGYGCGTFTQRAELVGPAVERYLKPLLVGRAADRIDDIWQMAYNSSYWRNDAVLNNAMSGVDEALWDIKGRQANMPVYQLLGGKCREAAATYQSVFGMEIPALLDEARKILATGTRTIKFQIGVPGQAGYASSDGPRAKSLHNDPVFEPDDYLRATMKFLEAARKQLGDDVGMIHDVHERVSPRQAVQLAKDVEPLKLFYLEDVLSPEDIAYFRQVRAQCTTPLAMGELFNNPNEWMPLISERLIDYIRVHVSQAGGITPCRKIAILSEMFGVKTAWHGPGDVSPIGHAAQLHLALASYNFGIQEHGGFTDTEREVFPGLPVLKDGYLWANDKPGWGMEVDEKLAAKYPFGSNDYPEVRPYNGGWGVIRRKDGAVIKQ
jgi:mannonate dehydratase